MTEHLMYPYTRFNMPDTNRNIYVSDFDVEFGDSLSEDFCGPSGDGWVQSRRSSWDKNIIACSCDRDCPTTAFTEDDVEIWYVKRQGNPWNWIPARAIGKLKDERYFYVVSTKSLNSYHNRAYVCRELAGLILFGLTDDDRAEIGWEALGI